MNLDISICPHEPHADAMDAAGQADTIDQIKDENRLDLIRDLCDCVAPGDVQEACEYVLNFHEVTFTIWDSKQEKRRPATDDELQETCEAIYFDSETDFSDEDMARAYLIWEAASGVGNWAEGND